MGKDYTKCTYACKTKSWGWVCTYEDITLPDFCSEECFTEEENSVSRTLKERVLEWDYDNSHSTCKVVTINFEESE